MLLRVAPVDDLAPGMRRRVSVPNSRRVVLVLIENDGVFAIENSCPHHGSTFDGGAVTESYLVCPWHFWRVDFRTGSCLHNPMVKAPIYPTSEIDGVLFVDVPPAPEEFLGEFAVPPSS